MSHTPAATPPPLATDATQVFCIECPNGCSVVVDVVAGQVIGVRGNTCNKGAAFALQERIEPKRHLTTTLAIEGAYVERAQVKTNGQVPQALLDSIREFLHTLHLQAPIERGQVIVADIFNTGVDVIASRDVPAKPPR